MKSIVLLCSLLVVICACSSNPEKNEIEQNENAPQDTLKTEIEEEIIPPPKPRINNGLENLVLNHYKEKYQSGKLLSVDHGITVRLDSLKNTVYVDTTLMSSANLDFFEGKYPEYLEKPSNPVRAIDSSLLAYTYVGSNGFPIVAGSDFINNRDNYQVGDMVILISKAFYHNGAYYVHVWTLNHDAKYFHEQKMTFKFDRQKELVEIAGSNQYQIGYSKTMTIFESINKDDNRTWQTWR